MFDKFGDYVLAFLLLCGLHVLGTAIPGWLLIWRKRKRKLKKKADITTKLDENVPPTDQNTPEIDQGLSVMSQNATKSDQDLAKLSQDIAKPSHDLAKIDPDYSTNYLLELEDDDDADLSRKEVQKV